MGDKSRTNLRSLVGPMTSFLVVAAAICLMTTLGAWMVSAGVLSAPQLVVAAAADDTEIETSITPEPTATPVMVGEPVTPVATAEPEDATPTPAPTADVSTPTPAVTGTQHVVQEGETLSIIARAYSVSVEDLVAANGLVDPDTIYSGQVLTIPAEVGSTPVTTPVTPVPATPTPILTPALPPKIQEDRWIDIDLSEQRLTAYEGGTPVRTTLVSTGLPQTPTPEGQFRIWIKLRYDDMAGADYYIEDVPYVMYFHEGYGLHGVTWHGNFGHPMSHGCVNLPTPEAEWLFNWTDVGTLVNIHE
jgi:lipoprotein-anchoring transpeptidase ErfK/SrfK